jgi:hypothetical protein
MSSSTIQASLLFFAISKNRLKLLLNNLDLKLHGIA